MFSHPYRLCCVCSDFHALREFLCIRYVGMLIPALPEKRTLSKTDPNVVRDRVRGLGLFLDRALANPYLRCDADVIHFLSAVEPKDYDKLKVGTGLSGCAQCERPLCEGQ